MVFDNNTLKVLHSLTEEGKIHYEKFLEQRADEILFRNDHPFIFLFNKIKGLFKHD